MFKKILIANRGEIAVRIIRACKEWGIQTVAIHSDVDKESMHVKLADESLCVGSRQPVDSYLNIPAILSAIEVTNADAVHPGYGFLSENYNFAKILKDNDIKFIGPSPEVIKMMGDKIEAKNTAKKYGIPVIEGSEGGVSNLNEGKNIAKKIGYPILIKASGGGGGKGSDGGHNGLKDIQNVLQTTKYNRFRFGVGSNFSKGKQVDYVLGKWDDEQQTAMPERLKKSTDLISRVNIESQRKNDDLGLISVNSEINLLQEELHDLNIIKNDLEKFTAEKWDNNLIKYDYIRNYGKIEEYVLLIQQLTRLSKNNPNSSTTKEILSNKAKLSELILKEYDNAISELNQDITNKTDQINNLRQKVINSSGVSSNSSTAIPELALLEKVNSTLVKLKNEYYTQLEFWNSSRNQITFSVEESSY